MILTVETLAQSAAMDVLAAFFVFVVQGFGESFPFHLASVFYYNSFEIDVCIIEKPVQII